MKTKLLAIPLIIFFLILSVFFYLLILERDPSDLPSALINKKYQPLKQIDCLMKIFLILKKNLIMIL